MSPMVATYDQAPAMSAEAVTEVVIAAIQKRIYSLVVINYANPDMVGHTGQIPVQAVETVDRCLGRLLDSISSVGGTAIVQPTMATESMIDEQGNPWTLTTNPSPLILVEGEKSKFLDMAQT